MPDSMVRCQSKARGVWENHGSWLLLLFIGIACFMAGTQFASMKLNDQFAMMIEAHDRQDAERIVRINRLMDDNRELSLALGNLSGNVAIKAGEAAESAKRAAESVMSNGESSEPDS